MNDLETRIAECASLLRAACESRKVDISLDGRVDEDAAAALLHIRTGTLANWRAQGLAPAWYQARPGSRVTFRIVDLARFIEGSRVEQGRVPGE